MFAAGKTKTSESQDRTDHARPQRPTVRTLSRLPTSSPDFKPMFALLVLQPRGAIGLSFRGEDRTPFNSCSPHRKNVTCHIEDFSQLVTPQPSAAERRAHTVPPQ